MWHKVSLFVLFTLASLLWIDVFTYLGFLSLHLLPSKVLLLVLLISIFLHNFYFRPHCPVRYLRLTLATSIIVSTLYLLGLTLDSLFGQGYFYELIRLRPESLFPATFGTLTLLSLPYLPSLKTQLPSWLTLSSAVALIFFFLRLAPIATSQAAVNLRNVISHPFASYDHKMGLEWGSFYTDMVMLKSKTPDTAIIAIPANRTLYPLHSNVELVRYFLYPRRIVVYPSAEATHYLDLSTGIGVLKKVEESDL